MYVDNVYINTFFREPIANFIVTTGTGPIKRFVKIVWLRIVLNVNILDIIALIVKIVLFFKMVFVKIHAIRILFFREENVKVSVK